MCTGYRYLSETLGADPHDIALVTESSTAYGQAVQWFVDSAAAVPTARLDEASAIELGYPYKFIGNIQKRW